MSVDERVLGVIQSLYDAAMDEALWPRALKELADITDSHEFAWHKFSRKPIHAAKAN
jgi:hypothetical protein